MESYPYEPEERGSDYVRLASIAAGEWAASGGLCKAFDGPPRRLLAPLPGKD